MTTPITNSRLTRGPDRERDLRGHEARSAPNAAAQDDTTAHAPRSRWRLGSRRSIARAIAVTIAVSLGSGAAAPVAAADKIAPTRYDRATLSEMADDVLRRGSRPVRQPVQQSVPPAVDPNREGTAEDGPPDPDAPVFHIEPAREGIRAPMPPGSAKGMKIGAADTGADTNPGYQSNSSRKRSRAARGLSFSSGVLAPASGVDPALKAHADGPAARGREFVYGFLQLRERLDETLERTLADLGVKLLGPHDDHHKARMPVGSLEAIAALPEVEWVGLSTREQKRSRELSELSTARAKATGIDNATSIPIVINLFEGDEAGAFRHELEAAGVTVGEYDADLHFYRGVATQPIIDAIAGLDFVQFVELIGIISDDHDQSMALVDADMIRPGTPLGLTRYSGASTLVGILDGGFMISPYATIPHRDLHKEACGQNFTNDQGGAFLDLKGHGTHVLATLAGTGTVNPRYRGVATGVGSYEQIRAAKVTGSNGQGQSSWAESAMDFMASFEDCTSAPPEVINMSNSTPREAGDPAFTGTDSLSRKLDEMVWSRGQAYIVSAGNKGPGPETIGKPGVAKNALTVGNVFDRTYLGVGDIANTSSRGPTGDGRMKPNLVAPGNIITSAKAGTTDGYTDDHGTSFATPHVTGIAATVMEHYSEFKGRPAFLRSHLMATAIAHDDVTGKSNEYGLGRVSGYLAHWDSPNSDGWSTYWFYGGVNGGEGYAWGDITVPVNTKRLVVVMTWDEPAASAGATRAVTYDLNLWADHNKDCTNPSGACGEYSSLSDVDNVEYLVVNNPPAGQYRLKVQPANAPVFPLRYGMTAVVIRGDTTPEMFAIMTPPETPPVVGQTFEVKALFLTPAYVVSGLQVQPRSTPPGVTFITAMTKRHDGVTMTFPDTPDNLTLGNLVPTHGRQVTYVYRADTPGSKTFFVRGWSENGGEVVGTTTVNVGAGTLNFADLMQTALTMNPPAPVRGPGSTFSVTDTVHNAGTATSSSSTTRYYLSLDAMKSADDVLLTGSHAPGGLVPGASHSATVTVTIPASTPANNYFLLACADAQSTVTELDEGNNCIATPGATVMVTRPDLSATAVTSNPPAPVRAPGTTLSVTDTVQNVGQAASGSSTTRYYLSLDAVKNAGDTLLSGSRGVPGLAAGASQSGTVSLTIPAAAPLNTYYLLACSDDLNAVAETDDANNCVATTTAAVTVTRPDLVESTVSALPATKKRGTSFAMTDTVQNLGAVASGASATRHYLSLDAVKSANDILMTGSRSVPAVVAGGIQAGSITVTIPASTAPSTYYVLTCADSTNVVIETSETNNCAVSSSTMTVTP